MADEVIKVSGLKEVQKQLYSYSQQLGDKVALAALRNGANLVKKAVQAAAPVYKGKPRADVKSGTLKKGFRVSRSKIHNGKTSDGLIGVFLTLKKGTSRKDVNDPFYGRWQNAGWQAGKTKVEGSHFFDKAYDAKKDAAADLIVKSAAAGADVLAKKVGL